MFGFLCFFNNAVNDCSEILGLSYNNISWTDDANGGVFSVYIFPGNHHVNYGFYYFGETFSKELCQQAFRCTEKPTPQVGGEVAASTRERSG